MYNLSVKCHQNFFECFECTDCPKLSKESHFASYLDLFFLCVFIVSILSSCTPEPVFILNVWPQKYITDFVAKQNGVACHLPFMGQTEMLKVEIVKTVSSIKVFWQFSMWVLTFLCKANICFPRFKQIYIYITVLLLIDCSSWCMFVHMSERAKREMDIYEEKDKKKLARLILLNWASTVLSCFLVLFSKYMDMVLEERKAFSIRWMWTE